MIVPTFYGKIFSEEIGIKFNFIKIILSEPEKYKDAINALNKDITYTLIELKKN